LGTSRGEKKIRVTKAFETRLYIRYIINGQQYYLITTSRRETRECLFSIFFSVLFRNRLFISHTPRRRLCFFVYCLQYYILLFCVCAIASCPAQRTCATTVVYNIIMQTVKISHWVQTTIARFYYIIILYALLWYLRLDTVYTNRFVS